jgi:cyclohexanone monooxygenase
LRVVESAGDFGGTWYWNRYPGAMCDVEIYVYLPLLEELGYMPKHKYSFAPEILEHAANIARHYRLYDNALMQTAITGCDWDEATARWIISTTAATASRRSTWRWPTAAEPSEAARHSRHQRLQGLHVPHQPLGLPLHRRRQPAALTTWRQARRHHRQPAPRHPVHSAPRRVGEAALRLPAHAVSVDVRNNAETDPKWAASLQPGWQKRRQENFNILVSGGDQDEDLVHDGWTDIFRNLTGTAAKEASRKLGRRLTSAERAAADGARRLQEDETRCARAWTRSSRTRRRPRR